MKYKKFLAWCNLRCADGCWTALEALACIDIIKKVNSQPFWKRQKFWEKHYEHRVVTEIVNVVEKRIQNWWN